MTVRFINWIFRASVCLAFIGIAIADEDGSEDSMDRNGRFLSMFEIINFPNDACTGGSKNGTCYTSQECDNKGGTKDGDCASGYGVCCIFDVNCGAKTTENNTYFTSSGTESGGTCSIQVCPGENICQLRLDFDSFVINGPYTSTLTKVGDVLQESKCLYGAVNDKGTECYPRNSQCYLESFSVTSPSATSPPVICGTNSNEHMYVDAADSYCNTLGFALATSATSKASWSIRVSQFECDYNNLAPPDCTQYFYDAGASTGTFRSFNYNSGSGYNLANQNQNVCFRRESGISQICYSTKTFTDFQVSAVGTDTKKGQVGATKACCGYGDDGKVGGYDCLMIPSAIREANGAMIGAATANGKVSKPVEGFFCGNGGLVTEISKEAADSKTVCSKRTPFMARFVTDGFEWKQEVANKIGSKGFELAYYFK